MALGRFDLGDYDVYRPVPRDRDYAFMNANGLMVGMLRGLLPKVQAFKEKLPSVGALTFMTQEFDRSHLSGLPRVTWDSIVTRLVTVLDDATIREAIMTTPPGHFAVNGEEVIATLRARRDGLMAWSRDYYAMVNRDADVFASEEDDVAVVERRSDGRSNGPPVQRTLGQTRRRPARGGVRANVRAVGDPRDPALTGRG